MEQFELLQIKWLDFFISWVIKDTNNNILMDKVYSGLETIQFVLQNRHKAMKFHFSQKSTISVYYTSYIQIK